MTDAKTTSACEFVVFRVGAQEFGVDIRSVQEIRGWTPATVLPHAPSYVRGVINLRGAVLPIVDLGERLGLGATATSERNVIIVVQVGAQTVGMLVDAVSDIQSHGLDAVQPTPDIAASSVKTFLRGILAVEGRMIGLVKLDAVMATALEEAA